MVLAGVEHGVRICEFGAFYDIVEDVDFGHAAPVCDDVNEVYGEEDEECSDYGEASS